MSELTLAGWTPIRIAWDRPRPTVDWCYTGRQRFTEPFFDQTIDNCLRRPFALLFRRETPLDALADWQAQQPGLSPTGFIFHTSRCGSTLIAQMLAALPQNRVISEASVIDSVLHGGSRGSGDKAEERQLWLRGLVSALGAPRGEERHLFIKFDCWHTLDLPLIRRAFPDVPWIFVYRDPLHIIASQLNERGAHMVPGMLGLGLIDADPAEVARMSPEEYIARVLAQICDAARQQLQQGEGRAIHYRQLPEAVCSSLLGHFRVSYPAEDIERMLQAAQFDAKQPSMFFADDAARRERAITDRAREMAARWCDPVFAQLEGLRHRLS